jgi:hypothetical protein
LTRRDSRPPSISDLGKLGIERSADETAGFVEHLVKVLAPKGKVAEIGERF